jgi:ribonuclease-3
MNAEFAKRSITPDEFDAPPSTISGLPLHQHDIERITGIPVVSFGPYVTAFTHKSACGPNDDSYERMEFVGDSVLNFVVAKYLFDNFPGKDEGFLTRLRTKLVSGKFLSTLAWKMGLQNLIVMNQKALSRGWNANHRILEDVFEALVGAVYLDLGMIAARDFILTTIRQHADFNDVMVDTNHKDRLSRHLRKLGVAPATFAVVHESGGANALFVVEATTGDAVIGRGEAKTKRDAEQHASRDALRRLGVPDETIA